LLQLRIIAAINEVIMGFLTSKHSKKYGKLVWRYHWDEYVNGKRVQRKESLGPISNREAKRIFLDRDRQIRLEKVGAVDKIKTGIQLKDFIKTYLDYGVSRKRPSTIALDKKNLNDLLDELGDVKIASIQLQDMDHYITKLLQHRSASGTNISMRHLKAAFNKAVKWNYIYRNPMQEIKPIPVEKRNDQELFLSLEQIDLFKKAIIGNPLESILHFYLQTGCRLNEAVLLMWEDVDFDNRTILFRAAVTKSREGRYFYFGKGGRLESLLEHQNPQPGRPVFPSTRNKDKPFSHFWVSTKARRIFDDIGLPWATVHTLRHTFATHLANSGMAMPVLSGILGHSDTKLTERYYIHRDRKISEDAITNLPY
jgi:integrase